MRERFGPEPARELAHCTVTIHYSTPGGYKEYHKSATGHRSLPSLPYILYFLWLRFWLGHVSRTGNASSRAYYKSRGGRALTRALIYIRLRVLKKPHLCSIARVTSHARFCQIQKHGTLFLCLAHTSAPFQNCLKTVLHDSLSILSLTPSNSVGHSFLSASRLSNWPI